MLYDATNPIFRIVSVEHLRWKAGVFRVAPRSYSALAFRISGSALISTDGKDHSIGESDILYLPQNKEYTAQYTDTDMIVIHFVTVADDPEIEIYPFEDGEQIYKLFLRSQFLWERKKPGYMVHSMAQLYTILGTILEKETEAALPEHFLKGVSLINAHYKDSSLSVDAVCAQAGIASTTFRSLFKRYYRKTPVEYITELRMEYARNLISSGTFIETAAFESGFNDPKYFSRVVKKYFGCPPRDLKTYGK